MGSSAPKSETVVKGGKPVIVREWVSPEYLKKFTELADYYGNRAIQERSTYQNMVNAERAARGKVPLYPTMTTTEGQIVTPGVVSTPFDATNLVTSAQESGMFNLPKRQKPIKKEKPEQDSRLGYLGALQATSSNSGLNR